MGKNTETGQQDYRALAAWVNAEMERQQLQASDIAERGGVSWPTLTEILDGVPRKRRPASLRRLSEALGYPADTASRILGGLPVESPAATGDKERIRRLESDVTELRREFAEVRRLLEQLLRRDD